ncbi:hypothetical protein D6D01_07701 [Aureobasidium pullulans]|uniref:Uncharacterized protein n=1 Tax=Aureobasidium pullulans TaxID=5580 RepID=A0A4S9KLD2_AURPU|nr:hypothetical protein D6D01_07701 [Aureobasidium pullulans]
MNIYFDKASPTSKYSPATSQRLQEPPRQTHSTSTQKPRVRFSLDSTWDRQNPNSERQASRHEQAHEPSVSSPAAINVNQNRREMLSEHRSQSDGQGRAQVEAKEQSRKRVRLLSPEGMHREPLPRAQNLYHHSEAVRPSSRVEARGQVIPSQVNQSREPNQVQTKQHGHGVPHDRSRNLQHHRERTQSPTSGETRERGLPSQAVASRVPISSQAYPSQEQGPVQRQEHRRDLLVRHVRESAGYPEQTQASSRDLARKRAILPQAQPSRERRRAQNDVRSDIDDAEVPEQMQDEAYSSEVGQERAYKLNPQHEDLRSSTSPDPLPDTGSPKPQGEYKKVENILGTVRPPRSHAAKTRRPVFQEDIDYPSDAQSFSPPAPLAVPASLVGQPSQQPYQSSLTRSNSTAASRPEHYGGYTREELLNFNVTTLDQKVRGWLQPKPGPNGDGHAPFTWSVITEFLDMYHPGYILESVKSRQRMYAAKLAMGLEGSPVEEQHVSMAPFSHEAAQSIEESYEQDLEMSSSRPAPSTMNSSRPAPPKTQASPSVKAPDAARLADRLEREKVDRQVKEKRLQQREEELLQRIRILEEESVANTLKLKDQEKDRKLKAEVEGKYHKLKEEAQTHKEKLKDEHTARTKAGRELKQLQTEAHRLRLAQGASTRKGAKADNAGFAFPKDDLEDVDKTPSKRKSSKAKEHEGIEPRADGRPHTAGKTLPSAYIQSLYNHAKEADIEEEKHQPPPEVIQEADLTYFVYTVHRKQWALEEAEPSDEENFVCGSYSYLNEANAQVTNEILRPHGNSGIAIDPLKPRSLHQGMGEFNMSWAQLDVPTGHVKVWCQRQLHTEFIGELPVFEARGLLCRTVFAVRQEITSTSTAMPNSTSADNATITTPPTTPPLPAMSSNTEDPEIYTTFDLANLKASEKLFLLEHGSVESQSKRLDDIRNRQDADRVRKQALEDLEDRRELFDAEMVREGEGGGKERVRIWVVRKTVVGPRN